MSAVSPLGIVACEGDMPRRLAERVAATERPVFIIALKNIATADFSGFPCAVLRVGGFKAIADALVEAGCKEVVLSGKFKRPRLAEAFPDAMASKVAVKMMSGGDDAALTMVRDLLADSGLTLVDAGVFLGRCRAEMGLIAGPAPDADAMGQIAKGCAVLRALGDHDVGQAVVIQGQRVIGVEAAEGTDEMLRRCGDLLDRDLGFGVLVKMMKSGQDASLDPPVIGTETVRRCHEAGIGIIAVEAGAVIISAPSETSRMADDVGITLIGIAT